MKPRTNKILKKSALVAAFPPVFIAFGIISHELEHCVIGDFCGYPENVLTAGDFFSLGGIWLLFFLIIFIPLWSLVFLIWFGVGDKGD